AAAAGATAGRSPAATPAIAAVAGPAASHRADRRAPARRRPRAIGAFRPVLPRDLGFRPARGEGGASHSQYAFGRSVAPAGAIGADGSAAAVAAPRRPIASREWPVRAV